jgi:hypothetical protein
MRYIFFHLGGMWAHHGGHMVAYISIHGLFLSTKNGHEMGHSTRLYVFQNLIFFPRKNVF